ncbi:MAG: cupin fold metalloprotein, WbuC family [Cyanobacteria bacterium]|jgi:cupin fold WbuC family metalloprotein|nr:cupin fold metalloprotein, WbuC family [Cyanobacteria bacterium GSL.Bin21]
MTNIKLLNQTLLDTVANAAANSQRLRKNHNFHQLSEQVQRFINIMQPGTYVRPHRHTRPDDRNGFEFFLVLQGKVGVLLFDEAGTVIHTEQLSPEQGNYGIEIAEGTFHTLVALARNSVLFELKEGPYIPATDKDFLSIFPPEGTPQAQAQVQVWEAQFTTPPAAIPD